MVTLGSSMKNSSDAAWLFGAVALDPAGQARATTSESSDRIVARLLMSAPFSSAQSELPAQHLFGAHWADLDHGQLERLGRHVDRHAHVDGVDLLGTVHRQPAGSRECDDGAGNARGHRRRM